MAGRSQEDFNGFKTVSELVKSLNSAVHDAEEALASRESKFKSEIEGKNKEIELLQQKFEIEKLGLEEERDELRGRLKEKDADENEIIELKRKNCVLECEKLRAQTDVYILERKIKELEGKILSFEKDASVNPSRAETIAGKRKVREDFVGSEALPETNANPSDGSARRKRSGKSKGNFKSSKPSVNSKPSEPVMEIGVAAKDPIKPEWPPSAFIIFIEEFKETYIKEQHLEYISPFAVSKPAARKWASLSEAEKAPFVAKAENMAVEYEKKMVAYYKEIESRKSRVRGE